MSAAATASPRSKNWLPITTSSLPVSPSRRSRPSRIAPTAAIVRDERTTPASPQRKQGSNVPCLRCGLAGVVRSSLFFRFGEKIAQKLQAEEHHAQWHDHPADSRPPNRQDQQQQNGPQHGAAD